MTVFEYDELILDQITREDILELVRGGFIVNDADEDGGRLRVSRHSELVSGSPRDETEIDAYVLATDLMDALTELSLDAERPPHPTGLVLRKTVVEGALDLSHLDLGFPLRFDGCVFTGWLNLDFSTISALTIDSCEFDVQGDHLAFGAVVGHSATVVHALNLSDVKGVRRLFLMDCSIGELGFQRRSMRDIGKAGYRFRTVLDGSSIGRLSVETSGLEEEKAGKLDKGEMRGGRRGTLRRRGTGRDAASPKLRIPPFGSPATLTIRSLQAQGMSDDQTTVDPKLLAAWIKAGNTGDPEDTTYSRQVWEEFASALDRDAMDAEATKLRILGRRFGRSKLKNPFAKLWGWILDATIGYGYANHRAFLLWCALFVLTIGITSVANGLSLLPVGENDLSSPGSILLYSLSVVLSPIGTDGPQDWFFGGAPIALALVLSAIKVTSLALLGLFLSGITGIISKR